MVQCLQRFALYQVGPHLFLYLISCVLCLLPVAGEASHRNKGRDGRLCESVLHFSVPEDPHPPRCKSTSQSQCQSLAVVAGGVTSGWWETQGEWDKSLFDLMSKALEYYQKCLQHLFECCNIGSFYKFVDWEQVEPKMALRCLEMWVVRSENTYITYNNPRELRLICC